MTIRSPIAMKNAIQGARFSRHEEKALLDLVDTLMGDAGLVTAGSGIIAGAAGYETRVTRIGDTITTEIYVDLQGLNSSATDDIIGKDPGVANCHLGQITSAINGTMLGGTMRCLEVPATGDDDIDLYSAVEATGAEDAAVTALTETPLLLAGGAWTLNEVQTLTALPASGEYLYLAAGGAGASATYTAGKFLITFTGRATD